MKVTLQIEDVGERCQAERHGEQKREGEAPGSAAPVKAKPERKEKGGDIRRGSGDAEDEPRQGGPRIGKQGPQGEGNGPDVMDLADEDSGVRQDEIEGR